MSREREDRYNGIRAVRVYDHGFIHGLLIKSGRKYDYVLTLRTPLRLSKVKHGDFTPKLFSIPDFIKLLKVRLERAKFPPSKIVSKFINDYSYN